MFLTPNFGTIIEEYSALFPDAVLTCRTNRIHHLSKQLYPVGDANTIIDCLTIADNIKHIRTVTEIKPGEGMSGFLMVIPKKIWFKIPFIENGGCLGVDSQFRIDLHNAGIKIYIMDGMLVYHQYRLLTNNKNHLL
jgi:hypothetical protein